MTKGNDILEFQEKHYDTLCDGFIKTFSKEWDAFVLAEFSNIEHRIDEIVHDRRLNYEMDGHDYYVDC